MLLILHYATEMSKESGGMTPRIFSLGARWKRMVNFATQSFYALAQVLRVPEHGTWAPVHAGLGAPEGGFKLRFSGRTV